MGVTARKIEWRTAMLRPVAMPSVECPSVRDWDSGSRVKAWMCVSHCLACAAARGVDVDFEKRTGEVNCAAA
jgi:hypothetical protein